MKLRTKRLGRYWWIVGDEVAGPYGPYNSPVEANEDRRGIERTLANLNDRSFWTTTPKEERRETESD